MRKFLSLSRVLLKSSMGMLSDGKSKKGMAIFLYVIIAVSCIPLIALLYFMVRPTFDILGVLGQSGSVIGAMMFLACLLTLIFSIFIIPSIFYFSSDSNILLSLPLTPPQILGAKFIVCLVYEYVFTFGVLLPVYAAYINYAGFSLSFVIGGILALLLLPVFPLVVGTIITILIMRFVPFFKNRDRFNLIAGLLTIIFAFSFSFIMNSLGGSPDSDPNALLATFLQGNNSLLDLFMKAFPMIPFFVRAMVDGSYLDLIIAVGIIVLAIIVLLTLGKYLYFKGAIGFGETSSSRKKLSDADMQKANRSHSKIRTYAMKDMKILIRTPIFFMNCIGTCIIVPLLFFVMPLISGNKGSVNSIDMNDIIIVLKSIPDISAYVIIVGLAIGCFIGGMNMISATAISREGSNYVFMKYVPMSYRDQIHAKTLCGIGMGILTMFLTMIPLYTILPMPMYYFAILFGCGCLSTIVVNFIGIIIDLSHPKLVWEQEAAAVKQNMAGVVTMLSGMAICALMIAACFFISIDYIMILSICMIVVFIILSISLYILSGKYAEHAMKKL